MHGTQTACDRVFITDRVLLGWRVFDVCDIINLQLVMEYFSVTYNSSHINKMAILLCHMLHVSENITEWLLNCG